MTSHEEAPKTSKPSSPSEEPNSKIFRGYCGAKGYDNPGPFHIKPKAYAVEEEMSRMNKKGPSC